MVDWFKNPICQKLWSWGEQCEVVQLQHQLCGRAREADVQPDQAHHHHGPDQPHLARPLLQQHQDAQHRAKWHHQSQRFEVRQQNNIGIWHLMLFRILYLHCNLLEDWNILDVLKRLHKLTRLTLHCNPLAAKKCYRPTIIGNLPFLKSLDFSLISEEERDAVRLGITAKFIR